jgi:hypothetical protein
VVSLRIRVSPQSQNPPTPISLDLLLMNQFPGVHLVGKFDDEVSWDFIPSPHQNFYVLIYPSHRLDDIKAFVEKQGYIIYKTNKKKTNSK